jgi:hypothetical protein
MPIADRQFEIEFFDSGVEALAFTFGCSTAEGPDSVVSTDTVVQSIRLHAAGVIA